MTQTKGLAIACLLLLAAPAAAQQRSHLRFGIGAGATWPQGNFHADKFGDGFNMGWQGIAFVEFRESRPIGVRVDVIVGENSANDQLDADIAASAGRVVNTKVRMRGANVDLIYRVRRGRPNSGPYLLGGIGRYRVSVAIGSEEGSENNFVWNAGGGLVLPVGHAAMFVEARYVHIVDTFFEDGGAPFVAVMAGYRLGRNQDIHPRRD